jgi:pimeloyl-ACP methyl ester carboxylesterase
VLLHAFPLSSAMWARDAGRFARAARVITPDLPGFGGSPRQVLPSIPAMAQAVADLLESLGIHEPVILAGLSMGGYVALEFLRQYPQRIKALGLFSTKAAADSPEQRQGRAALIERLRREGLEVLLQATLPKLVGASTVAGRPAVTAELERSISTADREGVIDALRAMADRRDSQPLLSAIPCPTLILAGAEDVLIPPNESEAMAQAIPGAQLSVIPGAGHLVNLEAPEAFQETVVSWIRHAINADERRVS